MVYAKSNRCKHNWIAIVIVTYLLDDSIMNAEDVEKKLGVNVLGSLPLTEEEYDGEKSKKKIGKQKKTA